MNLKRALPGLIAVCVAGCSPVVQGPFGDNRVPTLERYHAVMSDGAPLPLTRWLPSDSPRAAVVAVHGFNDHSGAFADLGQALSEQGFAVYAYDQRGFGGAPGRGLWPGTDRLAADFVTVTELIRRRHPGVPVRALGESMGAAVIMIALVRLAAPVDGAVLSAPAVWGRSTMAAYKRNTLDVFAHLLPGLRLRPTGLNIRPSDNAAMLRRIGRDPRLIRETRIDAIHGLVGLMDEALAIAPELRHRVLVLYGMRDEIIPRKATCRMLSSLPAEPEDRSWRTVLYPDGYHMLFRDLAGDLVTGDMAAWLSDPTAMLPSGHEREPAPDTGNPLPGFCPDPMKGAH